MVWNGHGLGGGIIATMIGLLTALIVVAVIIWIIDRTGRDALRRRATPDEVLAVRYARGELTDEEYRHRLGVLHGDDRALR